mgnify:FL=1
MAKNFKVILNKDKVNQEYYIVLVTHLKGERHNTMFIEKTFEAPEDAEKFVMDYGFKFTSAIEAVIYKITGVTVFAK